MSTDIANRRQAIIRRMIGPVMPRLWCPPITHYTRNGDVDIERMKAHWRTMVAFVGGFLVPGSTGDGWEMSQAEIGSMLTTATDLAVSLNTHVLVGVLRTDVDAMLSVIHATIDELKAAANSDDALTAMQRRHVAGFTVCPPKGTHLSQAEIRAGLEAVLSLGLPTAIYQLPQVTENEIAPDTFNALAADYANLLLLKDTSGNDHIAMAEGNRSGIFLVRGAEGDYAQWLVEAGGCYQGLLLSSANCFAAELSEMIRLLETDNTASAYALSRRISFVVAAAFQAVSKVEAGNAFANANKAMDHIKAYGDRATSVELPRLHAGSRLPAETIKTVSDIIRQGGFMPTRGYLDTCD